MTDKEKVISVFWVFYTAHWPAPNLGKEALQLWVDWILSVDPWALMSAMNYLQRQDDNYPPMLQRIKKAYKLFTPGRYFANASPIPECNSCGSKGIVYLVVGRGSELDAWKLIKGSDSRLWEMTEVRDSPCHCPRGVAFNDMIYPCDTIDDRMLRGRKLAAGWKSCFTNKNDAEAFAARQKGE